jgi:hypothetical protein
MYTVFPLPRCLELYESGFNDPLPVDSRDSQYIASCVPNARPRQSLELAFKGRSVGLSDLHQKPPAAFTKQGRHIAVSRGIVHEITRQVDQAQRQPDPAGKGHLGCGHCQATL